MLLLCFKYVSCHTSLWFTLCETSCVSLTWVTISFLDREIFHYDLLKYFLIHFFYSSSSEAPIVQMLLHLLLSQKSQRLPSLCLFVCFSYSAPQQLFLSSSSLICFSVSIIMLGISSRVSLISVIMLFIVVCLYFISSSSLLNVVIFLVCFPFYFWYFEISLLLLL